MIKLTKDNIKFIDTYLKNSDILFNDVRMEMVDHVASDIETQIDNGDNRPFYYLFKDYMVENKKSLQESNKTFRKETDKKIGLELLRQLTSLRAVFIFGILFLSFMILKGFLEEESFLNIILYLPVCSFMLLGVLSLFIRKDIKNYSAIQRLLIFCSLIFNILIQLISPFGRKGILYEIVGKNGTVLITTFIITTVTILFLTGLKYKKECELSANYVSQ